MQQGVIEDVASFNDKLLSQSALNKLCENRLSKLKFSLFISKQRLIERAFLFIFYIFIQSSEI